MKNIDFKSIIIGSLLMLCFFLFVGQRSDGNLGDIIVSSIKVKGGFIKTYNDIDELTTYIGNSDEGDGMLQIFHDREVQGAYLGYFSEDQFGIVINGNDGLAKVHLGSDETGGRIEIYNNDDIKVITLGTTKDSRGGLQINSDNTKKAAFIGDVDDGGVIMLANNTNETVVYLGADTKNGGLLALMDKYGEIFYFENNDDELRSRPY